MMRSSVVLCLCLAGLAAQQAAAVAVPRSSTAAVVRSSRAAGRAAVAAPATTKLDVRGGGGALSQGLNVEGIRCILGGMIIHLVFGTLYCWGNWNSYTPAALKNFDGTFAPGGSPDLQYMLSLTILSQALAMPWGSKLLDAVGASATVAIAGVMCAVGILLSSYATRLGPFAAAYAGVLGAGIGLGCVCVCGCFYVCWFGVRTRLPSLTPPPPLRAQVHHPDGDGVQALPQLKGYRVRHDPRLLRPRRVSLQHHRHRVVQPGRPLGERRHRPVPGQRHLGLPCGCVGSAARVPPAPFRLTSLAVLRKLGAVYLVFTAIGAGLVRPPSAAAAQAAGPAATSTKGFTIKEAIKTKSFWLMWAVVALSAQGCLYVEPCLREARPGLTPPPRPLSLSLSRRYVAGTYKSYASEFPLLNDDNFQATVGAAGALVNGLARPVWGALFDTVGYRKCYSAIALFQVGLLRAFPLLVTSRTSYAIGVILLYAVLAGNFTLVPAETYRWVSSLCRAVSPGQRADSFLSLSPLSFSLLPNAAPLATLPSTASSTRPSPPPGSSAPPAPRPSPPPTARSSPSPCSPSRPWPRWRSSSCTAGPSGRRREAQLTEEQRATRLLGAVIFWVGNIPCSVNCSLTGA